VAALLAAGFLGLYLYSQPTPAIAYEDAVSPATRDHQTLIRTALALAGIENASVIVQNGAVYVGYDLPGDSRNLTRDDWQRLILGTMAPLARDASTLIARQHVNGTAAAEWEVPAAQVVAYQKEQIPAEALEGAVTKRAP